MLGMPLGIYGAIGALRGGRDPGWAWAALAVAIAGIAMLAAVLVVPLMNRGD